MKEMKKEVKIIIIGCLIAVAFLCGRLNIKVHVACKHCDHVTTVGQGCTNNTNGVSTNAVSTNITPTNAVSPDLVSTN